VELSRFVGHHHVRKPIAFRAGAADMTTVEPTTQLTWDAALAREWPKYDLAQSYAWNYAHPPEPQAVAVPACPGTFTFCGEPVPSPLGMPAGPLLNGRWILYYAALGFDVLTYKTVRSQFRECYSPPNLVAVSSATLNGGEEKISVAGSSASWAVSFGMPSQAPQVWRADVAWTRERLATEKRLVVSVVGTVSAAATLRALADDYAQCARWAEEAGADAVEVNFSCPNVASCDGQLYQQPEAAAEVANTVRQSLRKIPLIVKIGHVTRDDEARRLLTALGPHVQGLAMTNTVSVRVASANGELLFEGQKRGIAGPAIRAASLAQVQRFSRAKAELNWPGALLGVGGAGTAADVRAYLEAGAEHVQIATAAMLDPTVGLKIRAEWSREMRSEERT